jgi:hypothetical protein
MFLCHYAYNIVKRFIRKDTSLLVDGVQQFIMA